jgi:hypothetical protein
VNVCTRCGRESESEQPGLLPEGWGHGYWLDARKEFEVVCDRCQFAEWVPHCTSVTDWDGDRVDVDALRASGRDIPEASVKYCDYVDLSLSFSEDNWPESWTCPQCGGTTFEGVKRDYHKSGLDHGDFTVAEE